MRLSHQQIRFIHIGIFFFFLVCLFYALWTAVTDDVSMWTWSALIIILIEGIVLALNNWVCPLTEWAEREGAENGSVADLFLPRYLADNLFWFAGLIYLFTVGFVLVRWMSA